MHVLSLTSSQNREIIDITAKIEDIVAASGVKEGICLVYAPHATASIMILELDGAVENDVLDSLLDIVPNDRPFRHEHGKIGHGASHVLSGLVSPSESIPISRGNLALGTWQRIAFCELDGPRSDRKAHIQVISA